MKIRSTGSISFFKNGLCLMRVVFVLALEPCFLHAEEVPVDTLEFIDSMEHNLGLDQYFLQSILGKPVRFPDPPQPEEAPDEVQRTIWDRNIPQTEALTTGVVLRFVPPASSLKEIVSKEETEKNNGKPEEEEAPAKPFEIKIDFNRKGVIFTHSNPMYSAHQGGVLFSVRKRYHEFQSMYFHGAGGYGAALFVPEPDGKVRNSALLCMRDSVQAVYEEGLRQGQSYEAFVDSQVVLTGAKFSVEGKASGRVLSGLGIGYARARVLTSKNVLPSKPFFDQNYAEDPSAHVDYYADPESEVDWTVEDDRKFAGGLRSEVLLQNAVGFKRVAWFQNVIRVRKIHLRQRLNVRIHKGWRALEPGSCYIIYRESFSKTRYSKEELVLPESFRSLEGSELEESSDVRHLDIDPPPFSRKKK